MLGREDEKLGRVGIVLNFRCAMYMKGRGGEQKTPAGEIYNEERERER